MFRFFEEASSLLDGKINISKENAHHISKVLRIKEDEDFEVLIDRKVYLVNICQKENNALQAKIKDVYMDDNESSLHIHLYQALPKSDKYEWIIQKTIELGVQEITPFNSERTIVKWDTKKEERKRKRFEDIALAAAKQAKRSFVPKVHPLIKFNELLNEIDDKTVVAYEGGGQSLKTTLNQLKAKEVKLVIGPEGGFAEEEIEQFKDRGAKIVHLGKRIMRTETAAMALLAMVQYEIGDINEI